MLKKVIVAQTEMPAKPPKTNRNKPPTISPISANRYRVGSASSIWDDGDPATRSTNAKCLRANQKAIVAKQIQAPADC